MSRLQNHRHLNNTVALVAFLFSTFSLILLFWESSCASKAIWQPLHTPPRLLQSLKLSKYPVSMEHGEGDLWQRWLPWQQAQLNQPPRAEVKQNWLNHITGSWQTVDRLDNLPVAAQREDHRKSCILKCVLGDRLALIYLCTSHWWNVRFCSEALF